MTRKAWYQGFVQLPEPEYMGDVFYPHKEPAGPPRESRKDCKKDIGTWRKKNAKYLKECASEGHTANIEEIRRVY